MDIEKLDINAVCFGILCNFTPVCGEEKAKEAVALIRSLQTENEKLQAEVERQRRSADNGQHLYENAERAYMKVLAELEQVKQERDAAIKEIFQWTGCPACKHWDSADNWCNKHDRSADSCDGCSTPEWHGLEKALRENVDAVSMFQHEDEWRGLHKEE